MWHLCSAEQYFPRVVTCSASPISKEVVLRSIEEGLANLSPVQSVARVKLQINVVNRSRR